MTDNVPDVVSSLVVLHLGVWNTDDEKAEVGRGADLDGSVVGRCREDHLAIRGLATNLHIKSNSTQIKLRHVFQIQRDILGDHILDRVHPILVVASLDCDLNEWERQDVGHGFKSSLSIAEAKPCHSTDRAAS